MLVVQLFVMGIESEKVNFMGILFSFSIFLLQNLLKNNTFLLIIFRLSLDAIYASSSAFLFC